MKNFILSLALLVFPFAVIHAQNFEGVIEFKKQTGADVVNYVYYVKGDKVRIDELTPGTRQVSASFILDVVKNTMTWLNHDRKLWGTRQPGTPITAPANAKVTATTNTKDMFGYKCKESVVKNQSDSTQISYWMAPGKFNFFLPMLKLLNRQEFFSTYYLALNPKPGAMPMLAVQKDLNGKEISRLEVTRLEQKTLLDGMFDVPKDYTEMK